MLTWFNKQSTLPKQDDHQWCQLLSHQTKFIRCQLINIQHSIWYSTAYNVGERGMVEYCTKSNKIINVIPYPQYIRPMNHACCVYKNKDGDAIIYIIDGENGEIISFSPSRKKFKKLATIPKIGLLPSCVALYDNIHIFHGAENCKHLIYSININKIASFNDETTTHNTEQVCIFKHNENTIIRFGGYRSTGKCVDTFCVSSVIEANKTNDIKWTFKQRFNLKEPLYSCGYIKHKHYIIIFGGNNGTEKTNKIYVLDLKSNIGWVQLNNFHCPLASNFAATLSKDNKAHIFSTGHVLNHYSLPISTIINDYSLSLASMLENKTNEENKCNECDEHKTAKQCLERLVEELLNNQKKLQNERDELIDKLNNFQVENKSEDKMETIKVEELIEENNKLKIKMKKIEAENMKLLEEQKNAQLEINEMKTEMVKLRRFKNVNDSNYMNWTGDEFIEWIINIEGGKYKHYEKKLRKSFAAEGVNGTLICDIEKNDWKGWGITSFADRTNLDKSIKSLINHNKQNINNNNDEGQDGTPYI